jgi:ribosome-binding protein aMBF1 (putative translation factor)
MAKRSSDALEILKRRTGIDPANDPEFRAIAREYRIGQMIHDARTAAGLSQQQLAELVGTTQSVISRLEDADYEGQSLAMLSRIAEALKMDVEVRLVPQHSSPA